jgi:transposase
MSTPMASTPKRPRRQFTDEIKAGVVRLVLDEGKTIGAVSREMDVTETAVRERVKRARADRTRGRTRLTTAERDELARLRKEKSRAADGARHPKEAATFFARHQQ